MSCPDCFRGSVHEGVPHGSEVTIHGRKAYVAEGAGPVKGVVVIIPDAFGWEFVNSRLLADDYAAKGNFRVYLPEFMDGTAAPVSMLESGAALLDRSSITAWVWKPYYLVQLLYGLLPFAFLNRRSVSWPKISAFFDALRNSTDLPIGAAGFCWGGRAVVELAAGAKSSQGKVLVDSVFTAHPSLLSIPGDIEKVKLPLSIAIGDHDRVLPLSQVAQVRGILDKLDVASEVVVYPGAGHGFGCRADPGNEKVAQHYKEAQEQAIAWFTKGFDQVSK